MTESAGRARPVETILARFAQYRPPAGTDPAQPWPPAVQPCAGDDVPGSANLHYHMGELVALLHTILDAPIRRESAVLTSINNGLPSILWAGVFERVLTIAAPDDAQSTIVDGNHTICFGSVTNTKFLYRVLERAGNPDCLIIDDLQYANIISPYFMLRRALRRPGMVVLFNTGGGIPLNEGALRFVADLRSGALDGVEHSLVDIALPGGRGVSYEMVA